MCYPHSSQRDLIESEQDHHILLPKTLSFPPTAVGIKPKLTTMTHQAIYVWSLPCTQHHLEPSSSSPTSLRSHSPFSSSDQKGSLLTQGLCLCWSPSTNNTLPLQSRPCWLISVLRALERTRPTHFSLHHVIQFYFSLYLLCSSVVAESCLHSCLFPYFPSPPRTHTPWRRVRWIHGQFLSTSDSA